MKTSLAFTVCVLAGLWSSLVLAESNNSLVFLNSGRVLPEGVPFSEAVRAGDTLYLTGQLGIVPGSLTLVEGGIEAESRQAMENIQSILQSNGLSMSNVAKCMVMVADIEEWSAFNKVYTGYFDGHYPARSAFAVNALAFNARVEVECLAVYP